MTNDFEIIAKAPSHTVWLSNFTSYTEDEIRGTTLTDTGTYNRL